MRSELQVRGELRGENPDGRETPFELRRQGAAVERVAAGQVLLTPLSRVETGPPARLPPFWRHYAQT